MARRPLPSPSNPSTARPPVARPFARPARPRARQRGGALVESTLGLGMVLLLGLACIEAMHWQLMRQLAYVALTEAARAGAVGNAKPQAIAQAFETAMLPRHAAADGPHHARERLRAAWQRTERRTGLPPWRIAIVAPAAEAYDDFSQPGLRNDRLRTIRNDYQAEQHGTYRARGWPGGRGPRSGLTVFEANVLRLRLRYVVEPLVPLVRPILRTAATLGGPDACAGQALAAGALPLQLELAMDMQSHPVQWPAEEATTRVRLAPQACDP